MKKRVNKACLECKKKHCKCEDERPCNRCKSLGLECLDSSKESSEIIFVPMKRKIEEEEDNLDEMIKDHERYNFKLQLELDLNTYITGILFILNFRKIYYNKISLF